MKHGKKYKSGAELKNVPAGNKGLPKLPKAVRNQMGYKKMGGEKLLMQMIVTGKHIKNLKLLWL